jgi:hypothetical protein
MRNRRSECFDLQKRFKCVYVCLITFDNLLLLKMSIYLRVRCVLAFPSVFVVAVYSVVPLVLYFIRVLFLILIVLRVLLIPTILRLTTQNTCYTYKNMQQPIAPCS